MSRSRTAFLEFFEDFKNKNRRSEIEYEDFGFPAELNFYDFFRLYKRSGMAHAVVHRHPDTVFTTNPRILENDQQHEQTPFELEFEQLADDINLWSKMHAADCRNRVGAYSALYLVFSDGGTDTEVTKGSKLLRMQPLFQNQIEPSSYCDNINDIRFGQPDIYKFIPKTDKKSSAPTATFNIHHTRVIILAEGADDDSINGVSALENCYNDIISYDRINGACGRGYWNASRGALTITDGDGEDAGSLMDALGAETPEEISEKLESVVRDFNSGQDKALALGNLKVQPLQFTLPDPSGFSSTVLNSIAASCSCPGPILIGQQLSQRSSDGNENSWLDTCESRRLRFNNPVIRDFVSRLLKYECFENKPANGDFVIVWDKLAEDTLTEKLELSLKMSNVNVNNIRGGGVSPFSAQEIREVAGYTDEIDEDNAYAEPFEQSQDNDKGAAAN